MVPRTGVGSPHWVARLTCSVALTAAAGLLPVRAEADAPCNAQSADALLACMGDGQLFIELTGDARRSDDGQYAYVDIDLGGADMTIIAGEHPLPFMRISGTGSMTVTGGRLALADGVDLPVDDTTTGGGSTLLPMSRYLIRVYGEASLSLSGTELDLPPPADDTHPFAVVELRGGKKPGTDQVFDDTTAGAQVDMRQIWARSDRPLSYALAVTAFDHPHASTFRLAQSKLHVDDGAIAHAARFVGDDRSLGLDGSVILDRTWFEPATDAPEDFTVGATVSAVEDVHPADIPFLSSGGALRVTNTRFSQLQTADGPLVESTSILFDQVMVDGLEDHAPSLDGDRVVLAIGRQVFVQSSLMCDLRGGDAVFGSTGSGAARPRGIHVVNSALWQLEQSLLELPLEDGAVHDAATVVIANVTLHHDAPLSTGARRSLVVPDEPTDTLPLVILQNSYLQGAWSLAELAADSAVVRTVMGDAVSAGGCGHFSDGGGCTHSTTLHLDAGYAAASCTSAMDELTLSLLEEVANNRWQPKEFADLKHITAGSLDTTEALRRPALRRITEPVSGEEWKLPTDGDEGWEASEWCWSNGEAAAAEIGAWSSGPEGFSDVETSCSLPMLEPYDLPEGAILDSGIIDLVEDADSGTLPLASASNGLESRIQYGLAAGCRYSTAAVWLILPLGLLRRRRDQPG